MPPPRRRRRSSSYTSTPVPMSVTADVGSVVPPSEMHEDEPVLEPIWYPMGPIDASLLTGYDDHAARHRDPHRFYDHGRKIAALAQPDQPWFQDVLAASGRRDLYQVGYTTTHNGMLMEFAMRWHPEISSFHFPHGKITITLDDVACLLHLPIRGTLLGHGRLTKEEEMKMLIVELGCDPDDALEEVERTRGRM
ncbi:protein MAIN-LIKE 1-like [Vicia villosa]|uniref:protein MAIN-LIKE 1-like n=1 Tax=Vicia villosa TaxID=3911 RepID=UPI00273CD52B|nr:protein MAIN-LIKE 1-like [Vicia villosa]